VTEADFWKVGVWAGAGTAEAGFWKVGFKR
jgi:hypothetical protein